MWTGVESNGSRMNWPHNAECMIRLHQQATRWDGNLTHSTLLPAFFSHLRGNRELKRTHTWSDSKCVLSNYNPRTENQIKWHRLASSMPLRSKKVWGTSPSLVFALPKYLLGLLNFPAQTTICSSTLSCCQKVCFELASFICGVFLCPVLKLPLAQRNSGIWGCHLSACSNFTKCSDPGISEVALCCFEPLQKML